MHPPKGNCRGGLLPSSTTPSGGDLGHYPGPDASPKVEVPIRPGNVQKNIKPNPQGGIHPRQYLPFWRELSIARYLRHPPKWKGPGAIFLRYCRQTHFKLQNCVTFGSDVGILKNHLTLLFYWSKMGVLTQNLVFMKMCLVRISFLVGGRIHVDLLRKPN